MAEEEKQQKLVKPYTVVASGMAAIVAALFTSKLGVAGTLIGTALTAMTINLGSAILSAQLEKASTKVTTLPTNVRDRLSTQKVRIPGKESPEPDPPEPSTKANEDRQRGRLLSRLRSIPDYLKNLPSARRRSILLAGILAGLVATIIGLGGVTGIELASGKNLSCQFWSECSTTAGTPAGSSGGPGLSIFGGAPSSNAPLMPEDQQPAPPDQQQAPGQQQRPVEPAPDDGAVQPGQRQDAEPAEPAQPKGNPNGEEPATPGR